MIQRITQLRADVMARRGSFTSRRQPMVLPVAYCRALIGGRSRIQTRAAFLREQVALTDIEIGGGWSIAGEHLPLANQSIPSRLDLADADTCRGLDALGVPVEEWPSVAKAVEARSSRWGCFTGETDAATQMGSTRMGGSSVDTTGVYNGCGWIENHSIRDYAKVLQIGFSGIKARIEGLLRSTPLTDPDLPRKENFWRAAVYICEAGELLGQRYADCALALAASASDPDERIRLDWMAKTCALVPANGARTFIEAVQSLWLCHILTCGEDGINANGLGRLDQILWPYYQADVAEGRLTRDEAVEVMAELACKLYLDYDVQAITLGGVGRGGNDAVNELSYVILDATEHVDFVRDVSIRLHAGTPTRFVRRAAELISRGGGIPFMFNDDSFIPALTDHGVALEDARDYAPIGCVELTIPGKANPHAVSGWFNALKCLELALFNGRDPRSKCQVGPPTGELRHMKDFAEFYDAYARQVRYFAERLVYNCNRGELAQREFGPLPCWSVLTDDCLARGRDITDGGAEYNYHSIAFMGTADTADALAAIRRCIFDQGAISADALLDALRRDFLDDEPLRLSLLRNSPKYGNDIDEVDELACRVAGDFIDLMDTMRSPLNGCYVVHLFSFLMNISFGKMVGATPDGRHAGEPLAYSLCAHQGRDVSGVTAMLCSLAKLPHRRAGGASAAIVDLDPSLVAGEAGISHLVTLILTAMKMGVGQLQWNVTTRERLLQAQNDPEHYGNIPVRVAGYSQMFKLVDRELQHHIIERTKHQS